MIMRDQSSALLTCPKSVLLARDQVRDRAVIEEPHNPGKGMMWGFLISVILWLILGVVWVAL
jgi:hypothetical protein